MSAYGYRVGADDAAKRIVRLEVVQHGLDYEFPIGSVLRASDGAALQLVRRRHRDGEQQTWWCRASSHRVVSHVAVTGDRGIVGLR